MGDVSDFFKSGFLDLCKNTIGKKYQQKSLRDRVSNFNNIRRETRNTLILQKRQIDENMTPVNTPQSSRIVKKNVEKVDVKNKPNKRLEMLQKWKIEKQKRKEEEKRKAKPLFKVCHVPDEMGLPNLENVYKTIKSKPIKLNQSISCVHQSQFAPPNYKFHAPKNLKPVHIDPISKGPRSVTSKVDFSNSQKKFSSKVIANKNVPQRTTRAATRNLQSEVREAVNSEIIHVVENVSKKNQRENYKHSSNSVKETVNSKGESKTIKPRIKEVSPHIHKGNAKNSKPKTGASTRLKQTSIKEERNEGVVTRKKLFIASSVSHADVINQNKGKEKLPLKASDRIKEKNVSNQLTTKGSDISEMSVLSTPAKTSGKASCKNLRWNRIEVLGDQDHYTDINTKTPKTTPRKYKKTPLKNTKASNVKEVNSPVTPKNVKNSNRRSRKVDSKNEKRQYEPLEQNDCGTKSRNSTIGSATGSASPDYPIDKNSPELDDCFHTPLKRSVRAESPVYISPFVTVSRGKNSARKEYNARHSMTDSTADFSTDILSSTSPKAGANYFSKKLDYEINRIKGICNIWNEYKNSNEIPEEANDMIDVAIGQSNLLLTKKFQQFQDLITQCRTCEYIEKPITCEDLHGFWDMMYMQVEDLDKRFNNLSVLKANDWQEVVPEKKVVKRNRGRPKKGSASAALKNLIKQRALEIKKAALEKTDLKLQTDECKMFTDEHNSVNSPTGEAKTTNGTARRSLRVSLLTTQNKKRMSSPTGLTMMKITQAIKQGDGMTPGKSILKNDLTKSAKRITKSVLFKDNLESEVDQNLSYIKYDAKDVEDKVNKENDVNGINLITFSPFSPARRSKRLSKIK